MKICPLHVGVVVVVLVVVIINFSYVYLLLCKNVQIMSHVFLKGNIIYYWTFDDIFQIPSKTICKKSYDLCVSILRSCIFKILQIIIARSRSSDFHMQTLRETFEKSSQKPISHTKDEKMLLCSKKRVGPQS